MVGENITYVGRDMLSGDFRVEYDISRIRNQGLANDFYTVVKTNIQ